MTMMQYAVKNTLDNDGSDRVLLVNAGENNKMTG